MMSKIIKILQLIVSPGVRGGGTLYICLIGMCLFQGIVFAYCFQQGVSKAGNLSGAGRENMSKREILFNWIIIQSNFCVLEYTFHQFFLESGII